MRISERFILPQHKSVSIPEFALHYLRGGPVGATLGSTFKSHESLREWKVSSNRNHSNAGC